MTREESAVPAILCGTGALLAYEAWALTRKGEPITRGMDRLQRHSGLRWLIRCLWAWLSWHLFIERRPC